MHYAKMSCSGVKKVLWILITLFPLALIVHVDGRPRKVTISSSAVNTTGKMQTTLSPFNTTEEKNSNDTLDYGVHFYEYPVGLLRTNNDTYGLKANDNDGSGTYSNGYYGDYYGLYEYPKLDAYYDENVDNSTKNVIPTLMTTNGPKKGAKKSNRKSKRETRSIPKESNIKHLCIGNISKVANINDKLSRYIFECKDKESKLFACINANGYIKLCYFPTDEKKPEVHLCIKKENASYVTNCNYPKPQSFCFTDPEETNRLFVCNDKKREVCFDEGLITCNQDKKRIPREIINPHQQIYHQNRLDGNCKAEMPFDEMDDQFSS